VRVTSRTKLHRPIQFYKKKIASDFRIEKIEGGVAFLASIVIA
jgi:hypothetical protein